MVSSRKYVLQVNENTVLLKDKKDPEAKGILITPNANTVLGYLAYCLLLTKDIEKQMQNSTDLDIQQLASKVADGVLFYLSRFIKNSPKAVMNIKGIELDISQESSRAEFIFNQELLNHPAEHIFAFGMGQAITFAQYFFIDSDNKEKQANRSRLENQIRKIFETAKANLAEWTANQNKQKEAEIKQALSLGIIEQNDLEDSNFRINLNKHSGLILQALKEKLIDKEVLKQQIYKDTTIPLIMENQFAIQGLKAKKFSLAEIDVIPEANLHKVFSAEGLQLLETQTLEEVANYYTVESIPKILLKKQLISQDEFEMYHQVGMLFENKNIISFLEEFKDYKISLRLLLNVEFQELLKDKCRKILKELLELSKDKNIDLKLILQEAICLADQRQTKNFLVRNELADDEKAFTQLRWGSIFSEDYEKRKFLVEGLNEKLFTFSDFKDLNETSVKYLCSREGFMRLRATQDMLGDEYKDNAKQDAIKKIISKKSF